MIIEAVTKSIGEISWDAYRKRLNVDSVWTLVHGDYHPANQLYNFETNELTTVDWEMVGFGSGPQELGQYIISHCSPAVRRECELELLREYYDELLKSGVKDFTWETCLAEYIEGGIGRWMWFLAWFGAS